MFLFSKIVFVVEIYHHGEHYNSGCNENRQNDCAHNQEAAALILAQVRLELVTTLDAGFVDTGSGSVLRSVMNDFFVLVIVTVAFIAPARCAAKIGPFAPVVPELLTVFDVALLFRVTRVGWHHHVGVRQCTRSRSLANHRRVCKHRLHRLQLHLLRLHCAILLLLHHNHHSRLLHGATRLLSHHHSRLLWGTAWLLRSHHHHHPRLLHTVGTWLHLHHHRLARGHHGLLSRGHHGLLARGHHHGLAHAHFHIFCFKRLSSRIVHHNCR